MTGFFNSNSTSGFGVRSYYYYFPTDIKLHDIGLSSYTRNSMVKFGKRTMNGVEGNDPDISEYFSNTLDSIRTSLFGDTASDLSIYRFDKDGKRYLQTTLSGTGENHIFWTPSGTSGGSSGGIVYTSLKTFQEQFDLYQKGWIKEELEAYNIKYIWSKITNSMSGCITFTPPTYTILGSPNSGVIRLYFQSKSDGTDRGIAFQPPMIANVATTSTGKKYSIGISESLPEGAFALPDVGGINNPINTKAGPLKLHLNMGTGEWESGTTQVHCQVLEDIAGVSPPTLPDNPDIVENSSLRVDFASGIAMVLTTEKGNPHLCVPCSFGCSVSPKEKIVLINRSIRAFGKGEIVLASQINGDWVPVPLANGLSGPAKKIEPQWSQIQKYIVNSKGFFRNKNDTQFIDPQDYINAIRAKFYDSLPSTTFTDNMAYNNIPRLREWNLVTMDASNYTIESNGSITDPNGDTQLSDAIYNASKYQSYSPNFKNYLEFYDADMLPVEIGGNNISPTRLKNTVISKTPVYNGDMGVAAQSVPTSWGMYFPDGYTSVQVRKTKSTKSVIPFPDSQVYGAYIMSFNKYTNVANTAPTFNLKDQYFYHMPAQMALNSYENQSLILSKFSDAYEADGVSCDNFIKYINNESKGHYLLNTSFKPAYGLTPINTRFVQFTPLSLELALSSNQILDYGVGGQLRDQNGYYNLKRNLEMIGAYGGNYFGNAWSRMGINNNVFFEPDGSVLGKLSFGTRLVNYSVDNPTAAANIGYPTREDTPDGGPQLLPNNERSESSNVVGIIAAKATIPLTNGGIIELKTDNYFGLIAYKSFTLSETSIGIEGLIGFAQDLSGKSIEEDNVQWGGSLGPEQVKELGTTALWCAVYDHCPDTIYDGRFFTPVQFNPSGESVDFNEVNLSVGDIVGTGTTSIPVIKNKVRRNMLLSNGGFAYPKKYIAIDPTSYEIKNSGQFYKDLEKITVNIGGKVSAKFVITGIDDNGGITNIGIDEALLAEYGPSYVYGETGSDGTVNPFKSGPTAPASIESEQGNFAEIVFTRGRVMEKVMVDKLGFYGVKKLTPEDNNGNGNNKGLVTGNRTTTFTLDKNSTGKYDIFLFFVNDIANYPEGGVGSFFEGTEVPPARYVNLEITAL